MRPHSSSLFPLYPGQEFTGNGFFLMVLLFSKVYAFRTAHPDYDQRSERHTEGNTTRLCSFPARSRLCPRSVCLSHNLCKRFFVTKSTGVIPKKLFSPRFPLLQVHYLVFKWHFIDNLVILSVVIKLDINIQG